MKIYDYLLFRIYSFYTDKMNEKDMPLFYTSVVSSVIVGFNLLALHSVLKYFELVPSFPSKYYVLLLGFILLFLNYFFLVNNKRFLERKFTKDIREGRLVVGYIVLPLYFLSL